MKLNHDTVIVGRRCVLVPYRREHVERYHAWMQDPDLLEATGSEPLSLEEEYGMQASWLDDESKCTFIVLARELLDRDVEDRLAAARATVPEEDIIRRSLDAMVGDVNLFLSEEEEGEGSDDDGLQKINGSNPRLEDAPEEETSEEKHHPQAELDIMVAERACRGKGVGREASCLMMLYGVAELSIRRFFCKINEDNEASLGLFRSKLDFRQCDYAACFRQIELELKAASPSCMIDRLSSLLGSSSGLRTLRLSSSCHDSLEKTDIVIITCKNNDSNES